ncbi:cutinase family protein [Skermania sp. ID1734]|uniref:cutinase family protein n=1 Tax=Skermania sp. ID1734 TaxID=2597516 RepID=UPI001180FB86|nr:cutinase family protein [Skermania sp. ID1734]TSD99185.1 cutinase family protein [Skermania sp. ID1734]
MRPKSLAGAVLALLLMTTGLVVGAASAQAQPGCPSLYVVAIPGTWETSDRGPSKPGMLTWATNGLPPNIEVGYVNYAATAFPWEGEIYGRSKREATDNASGMIAAMAQRCANTKMAVIGYSQGADAAGDLAAELGSGLGPVLPNRVAAVGLVSDPRRSPADVLVGPPVGGAGAGGPRIGGFGFLSGVVKTFCAPGDLYCSTARDDFVMRFAGFLAQTSDPNPAQIWRYQLEANAIYGDLQASGGIPVLQNQLTDQANQQRGRQLEAFYRSQVHQDYNAFVVDSYGESATTYLHNWLIRVA